MKDLWRRLQRYSDYPDPAAAAANTVAVVVALNGPFYPVYVVLMIGVAGAASVVTMIASPIFFAVPWIARRSSAAGRAALALVGILNTIWCVKLFGPASEVQLFCVPCIMLAALLYRGWERIVALPLIGLAILALAAPDSLYGVPLIAFSPEQARALTRLHMISAATLTGLIALQFMRLLPDTSRSSTPD